MLRRGKYVFNGHEMQYDLDYNTNMRNNLGATKNGPKKGIQMPE